MQPTSHPEVAIFPEWRFALAQPRGEVTGEVIVAYGREMAYHPAWVPGFTEVWDVTLSPKVDVVPGDIPQFKKLEQETLGLLDGSRTIVVIDRPLVRAGVDFYAALVRPFGREIVAAKSQAEAAKILGIEALPILTPEP